MRDEIIQKLIEAKVVRPDLKLNPLWRDKMSPELEEQVIDITSYLGTVDLAERFLNIRLGIFELPMCERCDASLAGKVANVQSL